MMHRWAALVVVLALGSLVPDRVTAQAAGQTQRSQQSQQGQDTSQRSQRSSRPAQETPQRSPGDRFELQQNYPNPFNPSTTIPFTLGDPACTDSDKQYRVTLRIFNVLAQEVAVPILQGGNVAAGQPVRNVVLRCGSYTAYWNGHYRNTSQEVASGVYIYVIEVNGKPKHKKMLVVK
jgi:hypothetical protein